MIRGKKCIVDSTPQKINIDLPAKLHNRFDFEVVDSVTGEVKQRAYAENIILDSYWNRILSSTWDIANGYLHIGTGAGTLVPTRTSLFTFLAGRISTAVTTVFNEAENWVSHKRKATWLEDEYMDTAWTEVGISYSATATSLTTHALIKDLNGNPVTLNKGATDIITVYSTLYVYLPAPADGIRFIYPRNQSLSVASLMGWLFGLSGSPALHRTYGLKGDLEYTQSGYSGSWTGALDLAYNPSGTEIVHTGSSAVTRTLKCVMARLPASGFNGVNGVKSIAFGVASYGGENSTYMDRDLDLQLTVPAPWYPYSTILAETVGTGDGATLDFKTYFPFVKDDGSFVLKKNGAVVPTTDYTVNYGEPNGDNLMHHMHVVDYYNSQYSIGCSNSGFDTNNFIVFENPWYEKFPIDSFNYTKAYIYTSDSPEGPWVMALSSETVVPAEHRSKRYWKVRAATTSTDYEVYLITATSNNLTNTKNIHFVAGKAPQAGDVVTTDYRCEVIAKTSDNVFDLTVNIVLQEKVV